MKSFTWTISLLFVAFSFVYGLLEAFRYGQAGEWRPDTAYKFIPQQSELFKWMESPSMLYDLHPLSQVLFKDLPLFGLFAVVGIIFACLSAVLPSVKEK